MAILYLFPQFLFLTLVPSVSIHNLPPRPWAAMSSTCCMCTFVDIAEYCSVLGVASYSNSCQCLPNRAGHSAALEPQPRSDRRGFRSHPPSSALLDHPPDAGCNFPHHGAGRTCCTCYSLHRPVAAPPHPRPQPTQPTCFQAPVLHRRALPSSI